MMKESMENQEIDEESYNGNYKASERQLAKYCCKVSFRPNSARLLFLCSQITKMLQIIIIIIFFFFKF
jgi:hypothetical protein